MKPNELFEIFNKFSLSIYALILLAIWSFFEAGIWFIIPDYLLLFFVIINPQLAKKYFFVVFIFSALGIIAHLIFLILHPDLGLILLQNTPFLSKDSFEIVQKSIIDLGYLGLLLQPFSSIPVKVWNYEAVKMGINLVFYLVLIALSRALRMGLVSILGYFFGKRFSRSLKKNFITFLIIYSILLILILLFVS